MKKASRHSMKDKCIGNEINGFSSSSSDPSFLALSSYTIWPWGLQHSVLIDGPCVQKQDWFPSVLYGTFGQTNVQSFPKSSSKFSMLPPNCQDSRPPNLYQQVEDAFLTNQSPMGVERERETQIWRQLPSFSSSTKPSREAEEGIIYHSVFC